MTDEIVPTVLRGVQPVPQPSPAIHEGGDCFACAHLAAVKHWWPQEAAELTVEDATEWWKVARFLRTPAKAARDLESERERWLHEDGSVDFEAVARIALREEATWGNDAHHARDAFWATPDPFRLQAFTDPWVPLISEDRQPVSPVWGVHGYSERVEAYLCAGWLGFTMIRFEPEAPHFLAPKEGGGWSNTTADHFVLLDGVRRFVRGHSPDAAEGTGTHIAEVHVVCSVKGGYWIDVRELLRWHGGLTVWWVRPRRDLPWLPAREA